MRTSSGAAKYRINNPINATATAINVLSATPVDAPIRLRRSQPYTRTIRELLPPARPQSCQGQRHGKGRHPDQTADPVRRRLGTPQLRLLRTCRRIQTPSELL